MKLFSLCACAILALAVAATPAAAAKKKKRKPPLGPVITAAAAGNTVTAPGDISTATATCPPGTKALGGGFIGSFSTAGAIAIYASYRSGEQSWSVAGAKAGPAPASATAFAYCRRTTKAVVDVTAATSVPAGVGMTASTSASCPAGTQLIGGGFISTANGLDTSFASTNLSTAPGTWSVTALQNGGSVQTMTAHAYCVAGIRAPTILNTTNSPPVTPPGTATATSPPCPAPKKPKKKKGKKKKKKKPAQLLTAGGYSSPTDDFPIYTESHIGSAGWLATAAKVNPPTRPFSVTSQGICL